MKTPTKVSVVLQLVQLSFFLFKLETLENGHNRLIFLSSSFAEMLKNRELLVQESLDFLKSPLMIRRQAGCTLNRKRLTIDVSVDRKQCFGDTENQGGCPDLKSVGGGIGLE